MLQSTSVLVEHRGNKRERIQLYSLEAGTGGKVRGYSGAPVIVRGGVVAFMSVAASEDGERSVEGTLYGVPLAPLAMRLKLGAYALPDVPADIGFPAEPYPGLHRFRREHARVLFGRDSEIADVIAALDRRALGLVLLSGQTGAGKSSLLEAGVLPRLESVYTWRLARVEQRDVRGAWRDATGGDWLRSEAAAGKPLLVVLDQLEDAWTSDGERLREWVQSDLARCIGKGRWLPRGRLILSFRKEWSAEIQGVLNEVGLPDWEHVHLKPLKRAPIIGIVHAIEQHARYGVQIEPGLGEHMAVVLLSDPEAPITPTLQIWLSELYHRSEPPRRWTVQAFESLLREGASLAEHVDRQLRFVPKPDVDSGLALDLLAFHVGPYGSSAARTHDARAAMYRAASHAELAKHLADAGLLVPLERMNGYRLVHDTLGPVVMQRAAQSRRPLQRAKRFFDALRLDWHAGPPVDDARGRLAPLFDTSEVDVVTSGFTKARRLDSEDDALVTASLVRQRVETASRKPGPAALQTLLADSAVRPSPSADHFASAIASANLRLLSRRPGGVCGLASTGRVLAFTDADPTPCDEKHLVWIVDPTQPSAAFTVEGLHAASALAVSHEGNRAAVGSRGDVCVIDTQTGAREVLSLGAADAATLAVTDTGDLLVHHSIGVFYVPAGQTKASWQVRRDTEDQFIHTVHGITRGTPHVVYQATRGSQEFLVWRGPDGRSNQFPIWNDAVLQFHPALARVGVMSLEARVACVLDLDTGNKVEGIAVRTHQVTQLGNDNKLEPHMHAIGFDGHGRFVAVVSCYEDKKSPRQTFVITGTKILGTLGLVSPLTAHIDRDDVYVFDADSVTRFSGENWNRQATVAIDSFQGTPMLVAHGDVAILHARHDAHVHVVHVDFATTTSTRMMNAERLYVGDNGMACATFDRRPFLLGKDVGTRLASTTLSTVSGISVVELANGFVAYHSGTLLVDERAIPLSLTDASDDIVRITRHGAMCFAISNRNRIHVVVAERSAAGGAKPQAFSLPYELVSPTGPNVAFAFAASPDGRWLLAGAEHPNASWPLQLWRLDAGPRRREPRVLALPNIGGAGPRFAFSTDGKLLATSFQDPAVAVWDLSCDPPQVVLYTTGGSYGLAGGSTWLRGFGFTPEHRLVVVWDTMQVDVFELSSRRAIATFPKPASWDRAEDAAILSPDGRWCVLDRCDGRILLWTADMRAVQLAAPEQVAGTAIAIDNGARWLVTGKTMQRSIAPIDPFGPSGSALAPRVLGTPTSLWLAPDGSTITMLHSDGTLERTRLDAIDVVRNDLVSAALSERSVSESG